MKLLVLSDLHIGNEARSTDLCPHTSDKEGDVGRDRNFVDSFLAFIDANNETFSDLSALIITGDISNRAHPKEFELANKVIRRIANHLNIKDQGIFFVPGNHDVHWRVMELDPREYWRKHRYGPFKDQEGVLIERLTQARYGSLFEEPYFTAWIDNDLCIIAINTASHDSPEKAVHHGLVPLVTIDTLKSFLEETPEIKEKMRVCLMHHHPIMYSEVQSEAADLSTAVNAENLMTILNNHDFDLIVHGHKHNPRASYRITNNTQPHLILGAGSFSSILDPTYFTGVSNTFHLLHIVGRDSKTNGIHGLITTWGYDGDGKWTDRVGKFIPHVEQFGTIASPHEIKEAIVSLARDKLKTASFVRWKELSNDNHLLERISKASAHNAMTEVAREIGVEFIGSSSGSTNDWLLVEKKGG